MSLKYGMAAINLEMTDHVPRTEYSVQHYHWDLIQKETGIKADDSSPEELRNKASSAFVKKWDFDIMWNIVINRDYFGKYRNHMGHANFANNGDDFDNNLDQYYTDEDQILELDPIDKYGIIPEKEMIEIFNNDYRRQKALYPDCVTMTGTYITLVSGLIDMLGWDMLLATLGYDSDEFGALTTRYADWMLYFMKALAKSEAPVVMVHDDLVWGNGPFVNPDWYRKYVFPNIKRYIDVLKEGGKKVLFTSDGNFTQFIDDIANTGVDGFVMEPTTDMEYIAKKYGKTHSFVGNADTRFLLSGTKAEITSEVERCMNIGKNCPGFIMAVGNHIPANTPIDNAIFYNEEYKRLRNR